MLIISDRIRDQLALKSANPKEQAAAVDEEKTKLSLVVWGIRNGQIKGDKAELRQLILDNLLNPEEIEIIHKGYDPAFSDNIMGALFSYYSDLPSEQQTNVLIAFRVLFEKNPLAIIKSALFYFEQRGQEAWSESAIERIGNFDLQDKLEPELSQFITQYAHQLTETELRAFIYAIHKNQRLVKQLISILSNANDESSALERRAIPSDDLTPLILSHWHPEHKGNVAYFYQDFPSIELWRLFMDGQQQEKGWACYEAREKGCINLLYQAWKKVNETISLPLTSDYFKTLHGICSKDIIWNSEKHFSDCNGRLFCNLILNRELINNGFSPSLLDNPNRIDGNTIKESMYELLRGMNSFQHLKATGQLQGMMSTQELLQKNSHPIPEIDNSLQKQATIPFDGASKLLDQHGVFASQQTAALPLQTQPSLTATVSAKTH